LFHEAVYGGMGLVQNRRGLASSGFCVSVNNILHGGNFVKNKTMWQSFRCAINGLYLALRTEKNFAFYMLNILITLPINIMVHFSAVEYAVYPVCVVGVFSSECLNSAVERLCDYLTVACDEKVKAIKDISAGAVLCWGIAFYIAEAVMLGGKFLA
jgi:diacylglycerol kinase